MVELLVIGGKGSNRLGYEMPPGGDFVDLADKLQRLQSTDNQSDIVNDVLLKTRQHAKDDSNGEIQYKGAAIIRTENGHWFAMPNIVVHEDPMQRDSCAERGIIKEGLFKEMAGLNIAELWYTGGRVDKRSGLELDMHERKINGKTYRLGKPNTLCGSCRDVVLKYGSENTLVHHVPLSDGTVALLTGNPEDKRQMEELEPNQVFSRRMGDLLPHVYAYLEDAQGLQKTMMKTAYDWIKDRRTWKAFEDPMQQRQIKSLTRLEKRNTPDQQLEVINKLLMKTAKHHYQDARTKPKFLSIAIARDEKGNYYMGKYMDNGVLRANSAAPVKALDRMSDASSNHQFTDIFIVGFDHHELEALTDRHAKSNDDIAIKMPNGAVREIIKKSAPQNGDAAIVHDLYKNSLDLSGGTIHVFLPNNPESRKFDSKRQVISMTIKELLPHAWRNPKIFEAEQQMKH